jgi:hypothetical protein
VRRRRRGNEKVVKHRSRKRRIKERKRGRKDGGTRADSLLKSKMIFTSHRK